MKMARPRRCWLRAPVSVAMLVLLVAQAHKTLGPALLNWIRCVMSGMTTSGFRRAVGQPRDAEDGGEQGSAHRPGKLPEREQKPLTSPPFCSDLLTELLSCRFSEICCAVCRTALLRIKCYGINIHLINDL